MQAISVIASVLTLVMLLAFILARRPAAAIGFGFIIVTLVWRTMSTAYIDLAGPVYASQLYLHIGPGTVTCVHVLVYILLLLPLVLFFDPALCRRWALVPETQIGGRSSQVVRSVTIVFGTVLLALLFLDMLRIGVVPLIDRLERFDYTTNYAGFMHKATIKYGNFLMFWLGVVFADSKLRTGRFDLRLIGLLAGFMFYMFLAGNRFSIFYSYASFFIMPLAALVAVRSQDADAGTTRLSSLIKSSAFKATIAAGLAMIAMIGIGLANNLMAVRGYTPSVALKDFLERVLVQPSEVGWASYNRTIMTGDWNFLGTFNFLFIDPIDPSRNSTPQYLMLQTIGEPRTSEHILNGFQFAGGFPEILFELFGPYFAWPYFVLFGLITAGLTALVVRSVYEGRLLTAFLAFYVLYGPLILYIGGMLNFLLVWTYWVKIAALAACVLIDWREVRRRFASILRIVGLPTGIAGLPPFLSRWQQ